MRLAWLELPHFQEGYYDALLQPLSRLGHHVLELRARALTGFGPGVLGPKLTGIDLALVAFGLGCGPEKSQEAQEGRRRPVRKTRCP